jgi:ABC-2 type transport system permease protein
MKNSMILLQAKKELHHFLTTPVGYIFFCVFVFSLGYITFEPGRGSFFIMREATMSAFFSYVPWLFLILIPAITMGVWAEERRLGTIEMLLTSPVSSLDLILGKVLGCWLFVCLCLIGTLPMVITVYFLGAPDGAVIFVGYLGCLFLSFLLICIGSFFSILTKNQMVSFILCAVGIYIFIALGSPPVLDFLGFVFPKPVLELFESFSLLRHYELMTKGLVNLSSLVFFFFLSAYWVWASKFVMDKSRGRL